MICFGNEFGLNSFFGECYFLVDYFRRVVYVILVYICRL